MVLPSDNVSTRRISVLLFWGGNIIETCEGVTYDRPHKTSIRIAHNATYEQLLDKLTKTPMVAKQGTMLKLTCRYPIKILTKPIVYGALEIETDDNVETMLDSVQDGLFNHVDLFVEFRSLPSEQIEIDSPVLSQTGEPANMSSAEPPIQDTSSRHMAHASDDDQINRKTMRTEPIDGLLEAHNSDAVVAVSAKEQIRGSDCSIAKLGKTISTYILLRLSVNSLLVCKRVCKTWRSLISHPNFGKLRFRKGEDCALIRTVSSTHVSRMLYLVEPPNQYISYMSLKTKLKIPLRNPELVPYTEGDTDANNVESKVGSKRKRCTQVTPFYHRFNVVNSCNGLLCLYEPLKREPVVVCNPITDEYIYLPPIDCISNATICFDCALGFSPQNKQYKVIRISHVPRTSTSMGSEPTAMVHTLGTSSWRRIGFVPFYVRNLRYPTYFNGAIHWVEEGMLSCLVAFTLVNEKFRSIPPPPRKSPHYSNEITLGVLRGCLCICDTFKWSETLVWVMNGYGVQECWNILVRLNNRPWGRECNPDIYEPITTLSNGCLLLFHRGGRALVYVYPKTGSSRFIKIDGVRQKFEAIAYTPSFVSLKDAVMKDDLSVLSSNSRHAGLKLHGETKDLYLKETDPEKDEDFRPFFRYRYY